MESAKLYDELSLLRSNLKGSRDFDDAAVLVALQALIAALERDPDLTQSNSRCLKFLTTAKSAIEDGALSFAETTLGTAMLVAKSSESD